MMPRYTEFGFTDDEELWYRISDKRMQELIEQNPLVGASESFNSYGDFLFITLALKTPEGRVGHFTFYGLGYNEQADRYVTDSWSFYFSAPYIVSEERCKMTKDELKALMQKRLQRLQGASERYQQSTRGKLYELFAEMSDGDAAMQMIEDYGDLFDRE